MPLPASPPRPIGTRRAQAGNCSLWLSQDTAQAKDQPCSSVGGCSPMQSPKGWALDTWGVAETRYRPAVSRPRLALSARWIHSPAACRPRQTHGPGADSVEMFIETQSTTVHQARYKAVDESALPPVSRASQGGAVAVQGRSRRRLSEQEALETGAGTHFVLSCPFFSPKACHPHPDLRLARHPACATGCAPG